MSNWKKLILSIIFIGFYFLILRPIRAYTVELIKPEVKIEKFETYSQSSVGITIIYFDKDLEKQFPFKMPFGMFFLFSSIGLIFINADLKAFGVLCLIQLMLWLIAFFVMIIGIKGHLFFLELMDLILRYLLPLSSLGLPAYLILEKRMRATMIENES